jgi:hypothetical protein
MGYGALRVCTDRALHCTLPLSPRRHWQGVTKAGTVCQRRGHFLIGTDLSYRRDAVGGAVSVRTTGPRTG